MPLDMRRSEWIFLFLFSFQLSAGAQAVREMLKGRVIEVTENEQAIPLVGANLYWLGTSIGATSDADGTFAIEFSNTSKQLVVSYVGYQNDTLEINSPDFITIRLNTTVSLEVVEVKSRKKSTETSYINPIKVERISEKELQKAACCNLSESFETSPSVDVSFTDAVTGTRQIQMLGLAGPYTQITRENMPHIRGLAAIYGLTYVPGTWVESIQLSKGTGSVVNGFESIAGQINAEIRKPETADPLYLNLFINEGGRVEANANLAHQLSEQFSTALLLHAKNNSVKRDRNGDHFLDNPLSDQFIALNRWKFIGKGGMRAQAGIKGTYINNIGGQKDFRPEDDALTTNRWGMKLNVQRLEGWTKTGFVWEEKPWQSIGLQLSAARHEQDSYFGLNDYDASQTSFYANLLFQSIFSNTNHQYKAGLSFQYDDYDESLNKVSYDRTVAVPGAFFEYTFSRSDKLAIVTGLRGDYHNTYGAFLTPRLHTRYTLSDNTVLRTSIGRGQRTANVLSENTGLLASSRVIEIHGDNSDKPYGLDPEVAWNMGASLSHCFLWDYREGTVSLDFFRTNFKNQIVLDIDQSPQMAHFYNLDGESYSNSIQLQLDYELIKRLDLRLAYRWYDVKTTYRRELMQKPLVSAHRAFVNLAYETSDHWKFDYTINWQGEKRIPFTGSNPSAYQLAERSPDFVMMNAQVSKGWRERFEIYVGMENLLNYKQSNPILSSDQPFSQYFDSSLIWGPIFGRNTYLGFRYWIR